MNDATGTAIIERAIKAIFTSLQNKRLSFFSGHLSYIKTFEDSKFNSREPLGKNGCSLENRQPSWEPDVLGFFNCPVCELVKPVKKAVPGIFLRIDKILELANYKSIDPGEVAQAVFFHEFTHAAIHKFFHEFDYYKNPLTFLKNKSAIKPCYNLEEAFCEYATYKILSEGSFNVLEYHFCLPEAVSKKPEWFLTLERTAPYKFLSTFLAIDQYIPDKIHDDIFRQWLYIVHNLRKENVEQIERIFQRFLNLQPSQGSPEPLSASMTTKIALNEYLLYSFPTNYRSIKEYAKPTKTELEFERFKYSVVFVP